jgi:hypothetical protein
MKKQSMQAAGVHEFTSPLRLEEVAKPEPGPGRVSSRLRPRVYATRTSTPPTAIGRSSPNSRSFPVMKGSASSKWLGQE